MQREAMRRWFASNLDRIQANVRRRLRSLADGQSYDADDVAESVAQVWRRLAKSTDRPSWDNGSKLYAAIDDATMAAHYGRRMDRDSEYVDAADPKDAGRRAKLDAERAAADPITDYVWGFCQTILDKRNRAESDRCKAAARALLGL